jgi:hypothetical protein
MHQLARLIRSLVRKLALAGSFRNGNDRRALAAAGLAPRGGVARRDCLLQPVAQAERGLCGYRWACPRSESNRHWGPF